MKKYFLNIIVLLVISLNSFGLHADRIKDMASVAGVRSNQLVGYGLVIGLAKTGDGSVNLTKQSIAAMISQFGVIANTADIDASNAANVMVTSNLPPFAKPGQTIDVTVSTIGKAKSLKGGTLLMTALKGADGEVYAIAQGNLAVGGLGVEGKDGSSLSVNIPTVGSIANGATVERMVETPFIKNKNFVMNLHQGDFTTANRIVEEINKLFGPGVSRALDGTSISVNAPKDPSQKVSFMSLLENIEVKPASPVARVVVNARTGTVVIGGDVRVTPAAVSHGSLTVKVQENTTTTPGQTTTTQNANTTVTNTTDPVTNEDSEITAGADKVSAFVFDAGTTLSDIVDAINAIGTNSADLVAILEALREAGALRAQMIII